MVNEGQYKTEQLKQVLKSFVHEEKEMHTNLDKLYHFYCGTYQENGQRKFEFKFLGNLGLNYFYWLDEGYLKSNYGKNWKSEYEKSISDFPFYHKQLKPFAIEILTALENNEIEILDDGTYKIAEQLRTKLESDKIYELKHPNRKYGS